MWLPQQQLLHYADYCSRSECRLYRKQQQTGLFESHMVHRMVLVCTHSVCLSVSVLNFLYSPLTVVSRKCFLTSLQGMPCWHLLWIYFSSGWKRKFMLLYYDMTASSFASHSEICQVEDKTIVGRVLFFVLNRNVSCRVSFAQLKENCV